MISYAFKNSHSEDEIVYKAKELYNLDIINRGKQGSVLGNSDMMLNIDSHTTRIMLFDRSINIHKLIDFIMENLNV